MNNAIGPKVASLLLGTASGVARRRDPTRCLVPIGDPPAAFAALKRAE
jgi:hypothetical protein